MFDTDPDFEEPFGTMVSNKGRGGNVFHGVLVEKLDGGPDEDEEQEMYRGIYPDGHVKLVRVRGLPCGVIAMSFKYVRPSLLISCNRPPPPF